VSLRDETAVQAHDALDPAIGGGRLDLAATVGSQHHGLRQQARKATRSPLEGRGRKKESSRDALSFPSRSTGLRGRA